ncbi:HEAT repeat domain-containing protein [Kitasatospora sp. NPDC091335]|uniref:HEAT repeat domain-containing protein n=1 Tax=Kitasatospora sp. NPDC091335 TaxID=3364085 RepID=UPI0038061E1D
MDLTAALAGLDDHPWAAVSHAYGPAGDLPDLLRELAEGDDGAAGEAVSELYVSILHQGTVYSASVDAVPFLARIAAAGIRTVDVLGLLGGLAESQDEWEAAEGAVRAAVVAQLPLLLPMLSDPDEAVRLTAAWAVGHTGESGAVAALRERWAAERDPDVAAELLVALGRLDPGTAADAARALLGEETAVPLRLAAVLVCLRNGERWGPGHHAAVLGLLPAREHTVDHYSQDHEELLHTVVDTLLDRDTDADREAAFALLEAALGDPRPEVRAEALWAADHACYVSRSAPPRLIPAIAPLAAQDAAASLLAKLGPLAAEAAPRLLGLAGLPDDAAADRALAALVRIDPRQAAPLLARDLERRPLARAAAGDSGATAFPFDRDLLAAVRARLAVEGLGNNETANLVHLLRQWGPRAVVGLPELCAVLPHFPYAASAVTAVAAGGPPEVRDRAAEGLRSAAGPLQVARAHYDVTGEPGLLLDAVAERLASSRERAEAAQAAADLGAAAAGLLPALLAAVGDDPEPTAPQLDADIATARAFWQIDGDAEEAVRILASVLDRTTGTRLWARWTVVRALRAAASLGAAGRDLIPRLEALLDDPEKAAGAVLALLDIAGPDTVDLGRLAEAALRSVESGADVTGGCEALHTLAAAGDIDLGRYVGDLVERDGRIVTSGLAYDIISEDERLRALLAGLY